jgi:aspartokinase
MVAPRADTVETIAVYWEPKIKTYGFQEVLDQSLLEIEFEGMQMAAWGSGFEQMGEAGVGFRLVLAHYLGNRGFRMHLVFERQWEDKIPELIKRIFSQNTLDAVRITSPVEVIFFHGPHFGDRYGIADSVFKALARKDVPVLAAGFSGSSVYLVLPGGTVQRARMLLEEAFEVPQTIDSRG